MATRARSRPRARPRASRGLSLALLAVVGASIAALVLLVVVYPGRRAGGSGRAIPFVVAPSERYDRVVERLGDAGVIEAPWIFAVYGRLIGADERLRAGETVLTDDMTPREVVQRIASGFGAAHVEVLVPEGFHRFDIAARLSRWDVCEADAFLAATADRALLDRLGIPGPTAEGYLYPDTYALRTAMDPHEVVERMVANFRRRVAPLWEEHAAELARLTSELSWGPHEVLTLASIVEKEAAVREEQPIIAGVFLNRLRDPEFTPHRLDADPTVSYGCLERPSAAPSCAAFRGRISRAMTHDSANPYNTYRREGLPPGPISNPGLDAIRAVLAPARHEWFFFVARGGGRHAFSRTIGEHVDTTAALRSEAAAAAGAAE